MPINAIRKATQIATPVPLKSKNHRLLLQKMIIIAVLVITPFIAYWQVLNNDFINFDDDLYITDNSHVQKGLSTEGIIWAFNTGHGANWHPITWLSHMVDVQLFGLNPGMHHLMNLLFHITNSILLFLVLFRMTRSLWQSAFVAALFALHPFHVESVAWAAERKDMLSTFFWMLTMGAYVSYTERQVLARYLAVLVCLTLGLMTKPMLVTLPFVLLLLDYWPLKRFEQKGHSKAKTVFSLSIKPLLTEKIPLLTLILISSFITYIVQQQGGAVRSFEIIPISDRIVNASIAYITYIAKMFVPVNLAIYYPHHTLWPFWLSVGSVLLFVSLTALAFFVIRKKPYASVGWLWYVGTLVPVIGLIQVGGQAMADRYTYIPLIGLFIIIAWGVPELFKVWRFQKAVLIVLSVSSLMSLFALTWVQTTYWKDSLSLYDHTLAVAKESSTVYNNRSTAKAERGDFIDALSDSNRAIEIDPKNSSAFYNRGSHYISLGEHEKAISDFNKALELKPTYWEAYSNRGIAYGSLKDYNKAIGDFTKAIELNPHCAEAFTNRGISYASQGLLDKAIEDLKTGARLGYDGAKNILKQQQIKW